MGVSTCIAGWLDRKPNLVPVAEAWLVEVDLVHQGRQMAHTRYFYRHEGLWPHSHELGWRTRFGSAWRAQECQSRLRYGAVPSSRSESRRKAARFTSTAN